MTDVSESAEGEVDDESEGEESGGIPESGGAGEEDEDGDDANEEYVSEVGVGQSKEDLKSNEGSKSKTDDCCHPVCCQPVMCCEEVKNSSKRGKSLKEISKPPKIEPIPNMDKPEKSKDSDECCDYSYYYNLGFANGFNESNTKNSDYVQDTNDYSYNTGFNSGFNTSNCLNQEYNEESSKYWYEYGFNAGFNSSNCENQKYTEESNKCHYEAGYNNGWNDSNCVNDSYVREATDYYYRDGYNTGINEANCANDCYTEQVSHYYYEVGYNDGFDNCRCKWEECQCNTPCCCPPNACCCPLKQSCCPQPGNDNTFCPNPCSPCSPAPCNSCNNQPCCCPCQQNPCCSSSMCPPPCCCCNQSKNTNKNSLDSRTGKEKEGNEKPNSGARNTGEPDDLYNNNVNENPKDNRGNHYGNTEGCNGCCCHCGSPCSSNGGPGLDLRNQELCIEIQEDESLVKKDGSNFDFKNITIVCEPNSSDASDSDENETPPFPSGCCYPFPYCSSWCFNPCGSCCNPFQQEWCSAPMPCMPSPGQPPLKQKTVKSTGTGTNPDIAGQCFSQSKLTQLEAKKEASREKMGKFECLPKPFILWPNSPPDLFSSGARNNDTSKSSNNAGKSRSKDKQDNSNGDGNGKSFKVFLPYQALGQRLNDPSCNNDNCCPSNLPAGCCNNFNNGGNNLSNYCGISDILNLIKQQTLCGFQPPRTIKTTVNPNSERRTQAPPNSSKSQEDQKRKKELRSQIQNIETRLCEIEEEMQTAEDQMCDAKLMKRTAKDNLCRIMQMISVDVAESFTPTRSDCGPERLSEDLSRYRNCDPNWRHKSSNQKARRQKSSKTAKNDIAAQYADKIKELEETITNADNQFYDSLSEFRKLKSQKDKLECQLCRLRPTNPVICYGEIIEQDGRQYRVLI